MCVKPVDDYCNFFIVEMCTALIAATAPTHHHIQFDDVSSIEFSDDIFSLTHTQFNELASRIRNVGVKNQSTFELLPIYAGSLI